MTQSQFWHATPEMILAMEGILLLQEPLLHPPGSRWKQSLWFYGRSALCIAIPVGLAELGKHYEIWHGRPGFPSGHQTLAVAVAMCVVLQRGRHWGGLMGLLALLEGIRLVVAGAHSVVEVLGGTILAVACSVVLWIKSGTLRRESPSEDTP